jgi:hypothetical protein
VTHSALVRYHDEERRVALPDNELAIDICDGRAFVIGFMDDDDGAIVLPRE